MKALTAIFGRMPSALHVPDGDNPWKHFVILFLPPPPPHTASARNGSPEMGYIQGMAIEFLHLEGQDARHTRWSVLQ
jgi:hypothetical protein